MSFDKLIFKLEISTNIFIEFDDVDITNYTYETNNSKHQ